MVTWSHRVFTNYWRNDIEEFLNTNAPSDASGIQGMVSQLLKFPDKSGLQSLADSNTYDIHIWVREDKSDVQWSVIFEESFGNLSDVMRDRLSTNEGSIALIGFYRHTDGNKESIWYAKRQS